MAMLRLRIKEQMGMVNSLDWLKDFLKVAGEGHVQEIFKLLLDRHEMTPEVLGAFKIHRKVPKRDSLIGHYLYPGLVLSREELLMRCALLGSVEHPAIYTECKGLEPHNNLDELREIALERGDRQSISILFYWKDKHQDGLEASEMLEYVRLGELSPVTTNWFITWALRRGTELNDWPLEHLPRDHQQVPKEDRLSEWLRSGDLIYENVGTINITDLYEQSAKIWINMGLTEPVEMKGGRVTTRAAEYCILNAQAILDTYRGDRQALEKISDEDYRKIKIGILYALAEGRHLDFSNTEAEMRKSGGEWFWFNCSGVGFRYRGLQCGIRN